jgi:sulfate/thiosulfate transport system ATP-binding protein
VKGPRKGPFFMGSYLMGAYSCQAQVERIVRLGFETRIELVRDDGERLHAQVTRDEAEELELRPGDIVYVRTRREKTFSG